MNSVKVIKRFLICLLCSITLFSSLVDGVASSQPIYGIEVGEIFKYQYNKEIIFNSTTYAPNFDSFHLTYNITWNIEILAIDSLSITANISVLSYEYSFFINNESLMEEMLNMYENFPEINPSFFKSYVYIITTGDCFSTLSYLDDWVAKYSDYDDYSSAMFRDWILGYFDNGYTITRADYDHKYKKNHIYEEYFLDIKVNENILSQVLIYEKKYSKEGVVELMRNVEIANQTNNGVLQEYNYDYKELYLIKDNSFISGFNPTLSIMGAIGGLVIISLKLKRNVHKTI